MNSSSKESYESSSDSSVATSSRHKTMHNKLCERVQVQYGKAVAAGTTDGAARPYVDKAIELTEKFDGIAGLWSPECPNIKSAMDEKQLQLAERAYRLAYPDFVDKEDGSLIKNPAAYRKLCKESTTTNRRKSYTSMTKEELLGKLATMPKDELVKEFIENIGYQRALTSSNQVLRSDNDLLLRRMKQKMN